MMMTMVDDDGDDDKRELKTKGTHIKKREKMGRKET